MVHRDRLHWLREIDRLDPETDHERIYTITAGHEFPWDMNQSLSFALFRTYAVPSIGGLLHETGEFTVRTQQRYDDTVVLLDAVGEHGMRSEKGLAAVRRINQMHGRYDIGNDDLRYVLATFVAVPIRWLDDHGWRPMSEKEKVASAHYYRELGRLMGIRDVPATWQGFTALMDAYEKEHFAYDPRARAVADATLDLMASFPPNHLAPRRAVVRFSRAYMDEPLLDAFHYPRPTPLERRAAAAALRARAAWLANRPPRMAPMRARELASQRSHGVVEDYSTIGTFPPRCPVAPRDRGVG